MTPDDGRVALVTGAGRGLGSSIARRLATSGFSVGVHYFHSRDGALALCDELQAAGCRVLPVEADVRDPAACRSIVTEVEARLGPVDTLVCNAGVARGGPLIAGDDAGARETIETNLLGPYYLIAAVARGMLRRRFGRIIAVGSPVGHLGGLQGQAAYAASKAGLIGLIRTVANELGPRGDITANIVSPGVVPTDLTALGIEEIGDRLRDAIPLGRFGNSTEVASAIAWLVGSEACYITGQELAVDGGFSLKYISRRKGGPGGQS